MKLGSAKRIMNLSKIDQDQLWEGFYKRNFFILIEKKR